MTTVRPGAAVRESSYTSRTMPGSSSTTRVRWNLDDLVTVSCEPTPWCHEWCAIVLWIQWMVPWRMHWPLSSIWWCFVSGKQMFSSEGEFQGASHFLQFKLGGAVGCSQVNPRFQLQAAMNAIFQNGFEHGRSVNTTCREPPGQFSAWKVDLSSSQSQSQTTHTHT